MNQGFEFVLVDDDVACRRMLKAIIEEEGLGYVIAEKGEGDGAAVIIQQSGASIAIVDLLLPGDDGIGIIEALKQMSYQGRIVMLSQVENKEMVAKAYSAGVEFFINKPINRIEVLSVLKRVIEGIKLRGSLGKLKDLISEMDQSEQESSDIIKGREYVKIRTQNILSELGIIGEAGSNDLLQIMIFLTAVSDGESYLSDFRHLKNLYRAISERYERESRGESVDPRAIEQRIRRTVKKAFENISAVGLEDYYDPRFERYSSKFFNFNEVRRKMNELKRLEPSYKARINIRQFITALYNEVNF